MTGVAAAPALVFRRRLTLDLLALDPALELGAGGEARVYALPDDDTLVAKLYHAPTMERARKLALMLEDPPRLDASVATLAWPCDLLLDRRGRFAGFLMPRAEGPRVFEFYNPSTRRQTAPLSHYGVLHRAGANLAAAFDALHARGYVVGDVNESNVLVGDDGVVTLVDTDSFQVRDPDDGAVHRSHVGKPEFTPPELQGMAFADFDRAPEHDRFGLAVLLFLLLMEGTHPFAGRLRGDGEAPPVEERIRRGLFPHHGHEEFLPPRMAPRFSLLHPGVRALFVRAFVDGHATPALRPTAAEWRDALAAAEARLAVCEHNPMHRHGAHLDACPWCERTSLLKGRDPFPAHVPGAGRAVAPFGAGRALARRRAAAAAASVAAAAAPGAVAVQGGVMVPATAASAQSVDFLRAFGTPIPWLAPLLWLSVFGGAPLVQTLAFFGFVYALMRALHRGLSGASPGNMITATLFLFALVAVFISLLSNAAGMGADDGYWGMAPDTTVVWDPGADTLVTASPASDAGMTASARARLGEPFTSTGLDSTPWVENQAVIEGMIALRYVRPAGGSGSAVLNVRVREDGTVDPDSVYTTNVSDPALAQAAEAAARHMRFARPTVHAMPSTAWVGMEITFEP